MSIVIHHPELGVYLGNFLGLGFWSKLDPVGQDVACVFEDEDEARAHVLSWDEPVDGCLYTKVESDHLQGASIEACAAAGLEVWDPDGMHDDAMLRLRTEAL